MNKLNVIIVLITCAFLLTSCASIINGTTQEISVGSSPAGAEVYIDGELAGYTPTKVEVTRKESHLVTLAKPGFHTQNVSLQPVMSAAVLGNVIAGGFIGWGVDAVSGAQYRICPETVNVNLDPHYTLVK